MATGCFCQLLRRADLLELIFNPVALTAVDHRRQDGADGQRREQDLPGGQQEALFAGRRGPQQPEVALFGRRRRPDHRSPLQEPAQGRKRAQGDSRQPGDLRLRAEAGLESPASRKGATMRVLSSPQSRIVIHGT